MQAEQQILTIEQFPIVEAECFGSDSMITINDSHPFFEELFQFTSMAVANFSVLLHRAAVETLKSVVQTTNHAFANGMTVHGKINLHPMPNQIFLGSHACPERILVHRTDQISDYLAGILTKRPGELVYEQQITPQSQEAKSAERTYLCGDDPTARFETLASVLIGGAFEKNKGCYYQKYGPDIQSWPTELQFFRHLRNGCFHSNHFHFEPFRKGHKRGQPQIDPAHFPQWGTYTMPSDQAMQGKKVVGGFLPVFQLIPLLNDMGLRL